jgi:hypothetical protein
LFSTSHDGDIMALPSYLAVLWREDLKRYPPRPYKRTWGFHGLYIHPSGRVWVSFKHDQWHLVDRDSDDARYFIHRRRLYDWMDAEMQRSMQRHLDDRWQTLGALTTEAEVALRFAYQDRFHEAEISARWVRPESLQNTQEEVHMRRVRDYMHTMSQRDKNGDLPQALQFSDSDTLFLTDGHHRCYAHRLLNRTMQVQVYRFPVTLKSLMPIVPMDVDEMDAILADVLEEALSILRERVPA